MREKGTNAVSTRWIHDNRDREGRNRPGDHLREMGGVMDAEDERQMPPGVLTLGERIGESVGPQEHPVQENQSN